MSRQLRTTSAALADEIIARGLPDLGRAERADAVRLVTEAISGLPDSVRPGVSLAAWAFRARRRWGGPGVAGDGLAGASLPVVREYVRLVRGLAVAAACEVSERHEAGQP